MSQQNQPFLWGFEARQLLIIALPVIAAQLLQVSMGAIDTVMAGRIDALALAAIALGSSIWHFSLLVGVGLMLSLAPVVSQHIGAGNYSLVREELRQGLWLALLLGIALIIMLVLFAKGIPFLDIEPSIIPETQRYLYWVCWSLPFSCLYLVPRSLNESRGFTMPMLWIQLALLPLNILGNYVFMFGNWGFEPMGAAGAALATGIAQSLGCVLLFAYTLRTKRYAEYDLAKRMTLPDWKHIAALFRLGFPISISLGMEVGMFTTIALLMGRFGIEATAGHQVAVSVASLTFMIPLGISIASTVRVGLALGSQDPDAARRRGYLAIGVCAIIMLISCICLWVFGATFATFYTNDPAVVMLASHFLMYAAVFQLADGLQVGASGVLRGYKDTTMPMLINAVCYWIIGIGTSLHLTRNMHMGPDGLWAGLVCGLIAAALVLNARFYWLSKRSVDDFNHRSS